MSTRLQNLPAAPRIQRDEKALPSVLFLEMLFLAPAR
jgi:hypothetical protein